MCLILLNDVYYNFLQLVFSQDKDYNCFKLNVLFISNIMIVTIKHLIESLFV